VHRPPVRGVRVQVVGYIARHAREPRMPTLPVRHILSTPIGDVPQLTVVVLLRATA
jgi:hypothetical protein